MWRKKYIFHNANCRFSNHEFPISHYFYIFCWLSDYIIYKKAYIYYADLFFNSIFPWITKVSPNSKGIFLSFSLYEMALLFGFLRSLKCVIKLYSNQWFPMSIIMLKHFKDFEIQFNTIIWLSLVVEILSHVAICFI